MVNERRPEPRTNAAEGPIAYPDSRTSGAIDGSAAETAVAELKAAGFAPDKIGVLAGEDDARRFRDLSDGAGVPGLVRRLALSMGADLDLARQAEQELLNGCALVEVEVDGEDEKRTVRDILLRHNGHFIKYFHRWTIETLA